MRIWRRSRPSTKEFASHLWKPIITKLRTSSNRLSNLKILKHNWKANWRKSKGPRTIERWICINCTKKNKFRWWTPRLISNNKLSFSKTIRLRLWLSSSGAWTKGWSIQSSSYSEQRPRSKTACRRNITKNNRDKPKKCRQLEMPKLSASEKSWTLSTGRVWKVFRRSMMKYLQNRPRKCRQQKKEKSRPLGTN